MNEISAQQQNPLDAPLWRKLLGLRMIIFNAVGLLLLGFVAVKVMNGWLSELAVIGFMVALFLFGFGTLPLSAKDLIIHFFQKNYLNKIGIKNDNSPEQMAAEFSNNSYTILLLPFYLIIGTVLTISIVLIVVGGTLALYVLSTSIISSAFAGWPTWAIVITFLLLLLLLKK